MKKALLLLCILMFAVALGHELVLDAAVMHDAAFTDLPVLSDEEYRSIKRFRFPWFRDSIHLLADGQALPTDESGLIYSPAMAGITVQSPARAKIARTEPTTDAEGNTTCRILRYDGVSYAEQELLVTGLPVMELKLLEIKSDRYPIGAGKHLGALVLFSTRDDGSLRVQTEAIEASERGGSSRKYEKKSHTVFFVDEAGNDRMASLLDFPADTKYALNSLFEDESKIRDVLALDLWGELDAAVQNPAQKSNAVAMEHVEVLINGRYWGLYGLSQVITPNALDLTAEDALYKINAHFERRSNGAIRVKSPEIEQNTPAGDADVLLSDAFYAFPNIEDAAVPTLNWDNAINYALLVQLTCASDNETRNMACCYRAEEDELFMIGWDLDQTFGSVWTGAKDVFVENDLSVASVDLLAIHEWKLKPFSTLFSENEVFSKALIERYHTLRTGILSDEALTARADALFDRLTDCGARARDAKRWPTGASSTENVVHTFIPLRTAYLDQLYAQTPPRGN